MFVTFDIAYFVDIDILGIVGLTDVEISISMTTLTSFWSSSHYGTHRLGAPDFTWIVDFEFVIVDIVDIVIIGIVGHCDITFSSS